MGAARAQMAMVFQNYALYPHMDVYGNLAFSLKLASARNPKSISASSDVAEMLEIGELLQAAGRAAFRRAAAARRAGAGTGERTSGLPVR